MNFIGHQITRLPARNEGKIKSFESCVDVRAWSHDTRIRDRYLRDWIKCNMPICVLPVCALASILTIMTCRSRGSVASGRHMNCKSKVLLESICSSCTVMKECLNNNKEFEKYFIEEELDTIHWPCDKCLNILKSVSMFWKIVIEKVLKIHLPRADNEIKNKNSSVGNVAKEWRKEIMQEAKFVKSATLSLKQNALGENKSDSTNRSKDEKHIRIPYRNKLTETDCGVRSIASQKNDNSLRKNISKCTSVHNKMDDRVREAYDQKKNEELIFYKHNIENLQCQFILQKQELDRLEKENKSLNHELQSIRQNCRKNLFLCDQSLTNIGDTVALSPVPYENADSDAKFNFHPTKDIDSEMIISLKKCSNKNFRNISMLQVLHKTNGKICFPEDTYECCNKEDPIRILNKVHETFGAIVSREVSIANKTKSSKTKDVVIKTTIRNIDARRSTPSCSSTSYSVTSDTNYESAKDISLRSEA